MYESPITLITEEIEMHMMNDCCEAVQRYGFDIDANELKKALNYDRNQYEKGYADGKAESERPRAAWEVEPDGTGMAVCSHCKKAEAFPRYFCGWCGASMIAEEDEA